MPARRGRGDVLLEQRGGKLRESLRRRVIQRAEDRFPFLYLQGEDAGTVGRTRFPIFSARPGRRSDGRARERRGRGSEVRRGTWRAWCAPFVADCGGERRRKSRAYIGGGVTERQSKLRERLELPEAVLTCGDLAEVGYPRRAAIC